jgi:periplasmic protein TonB
MTAATAGPSGPNLFSSLSVTQTGLFRKNPEALVLSLVGQALIIGLLIYFTTWMIEGPPDVIRHPAVVETLRVIFSGNNGGGGGNHDALSASHGNLPKASLEDQIVPPTVVVPKEMPRLPMPETVVVAPDVKLIEGGQIGDPLSKFSLRSDGPGGPGGIGPGCCDGVGPSTGPHFGTGPEGIYPAGSHGVTVPQVIYSPEPSFSDEARKSKTQGKVTLLLVVGKDGHPYNVRVRESLGMGLDEKAIEAVNRWRFRAATFNGQPVATQIAIEVEFHLY